MSIYKIIECDVCGKKEKMDNPYREPWYAETFLDVYCSKECFNKAFGKEKSDENVSDKI